MTSLYELAEEYQFLTHELVDEETGEVNETSLARINEIKDSAENKCINVVRVLKDLEAQQEAVEKERKRLQNRERVVNNQIKRLKEYLMYNMQACEISKVSCSQFVISVRQNPESVDIFDESQIFPKYHRIAVEYDKTKIKDDLRKGVDVPGARLIRSQSLMIR